MNDTVNADVDESPVVDPRGVLVAATAIQRRKERELTEAKAATQRVLGVVETADLRQDEADQARAAAAAATKCWAERGARADEPIGDSELTTFAVDAERKAAEARFAAQGAEAGLASIQGAEEDARIAFDAAQGGVQDAVHRVLLNEIESRFERIASAFASVAEDVQDVHALAHALRYGRLHGTPTGGSGELLRRLDDLKPRVPSEDKLRELGRPWVQFARALAVDPHAEFVES